ncbi:uncharacterized protein Dwil_GK25832 [Drosophila willistoni]|uniref:Gustatory receptor n=1 Tax=Drosophila willistoni TaxID=7260 RepID=B4NCC1_DROWI|nr:uncharacterized protein Dwil_GK25832 [Drosophila willistoni]
MSNTLERCLAIYFHLMGLSCSYKGKSHAWFRTLTTIYMCLMLIELIAQIWSYFQWIQWQLVDLSTNQETEEPDDQHLRFYVNLVGSIDVTYKLIHILLILQSIVCRRQEQRLLDELPECKLSYNLCCQLILEVILACQICSLNFFGAILNDDPNFLLGLREILSYQAVRSRYLQIVILIARLEVQLEESVWHRIHDDDYERSRSSYTHTVYLMQCLSKLYGPSILLMNILCLGDCIVVCNVYIIISNWTESKLTWLLLLKSACAMLTTLLKISIICLACHRCTAKSKLLRQQLNARRCRTNFERSLIDDYILHIMQNPIEFDVFGMYQLNLMALTGMFLFLLEALVIFLQFVSLTNISK